ncbi:type I restriction endonuclease subunit R [Empedobacter falsenii]|uniref:type I restriction endonuclease subunit R n=1 Tax=Empedobacter falsenii TaxID=343874 RepID=UPI002574B187|nr:type I restriction endonuclease [Empedobacter falsenii]MDM1548855.1 type I restriction endonuclease subunit R [Empedobacter falsenii]
MAFNEDSRVKIPALLYLTRLGYKYIPQNQQKRQEETNIFTDIFFDSILRINQGVSMEEIKVVLDEITLEANFEDLGEKFYKRLTSSSGIKLIDFKYFNNNSFHVTTELTCRNGEEEFRPDITILINGIPLSFIEVKKPNNKDGILAERNRINQRFQNPKFRRFANITQLMIFSNNMEYEDGVIEPIQGAYYATSAYKKLHFSYFREDQDYPVQDHLDDINLDKELEILKDNNLYAIKDSPEYITNKHFDSPTNRILTSLLSRQRFAFILKYALAYVHEEENGVPVIQKHIMRYPQIFATMAIAAKLDQGINKGIIWHTQGSGKTALAYYNVKHLTDYYQKKNIIPKFYFIVDRIDLLEQATTEFSNRGLKVNRVNSRVEFINDMKKVGAILNHAGEPEITVVNIQKFSDEVSTDVPIDYDINVQRIYFLDEAHRSYNPKGNYLANLISSDKNSIKIALTGTPLLKEVAKEYDSKKLFGDYIHKYYYNMSIADGYTLRLIREEIKSKFQMQMADVLDRLQVKQGDILKTEVYAHEQYVRPLLEYITEDLIEFRIANNDSSLGAMVVCESALQAKKLFEIFEEKYGEQETDASKLVAEPYNVYKTKKPNLKAALILHNANDKEIRKDLIKGFKSGKIDILFVYNMLLTGFSANRLKKLYLNRVIKDHNLLQALTRVNRPYKSYEYGYVVDFADISKAFDRTNALYYQELQNQLGDDFEFYNNLFKSKEEVQKDLQQVKETLFQYNTQNKEIFSQQIQQIQDKKIVLDLIKALQLAKDLRNVIKLEGYEDVEVDINFSDYNRFLIEARAQLDKLNVVDNLKNKEENTKLLNLALEDVYFDFVKIGENELVLADQLKNQIRSTREALQHNFDQQDPRFILLREELERIFANKKLDEVSQDEMQEHIHLLKNIHDKVKELNRLNNNLKDKYQNDEKYVRIHNRLTENNGLGVQESKLFDALIKVKEVTDEQILKNKNILSNTAFFEKNLMQNVVKEFVQTQKINLDFKTTQKINYLIVNEYQQQYKGYRY